MKPFEFDLTSPGTWKNFNAPVLNPRVPTALFTIGGLNRYNQPRLRAVWGGAEQFYYGGDEVNPAGWYLKYHLCFTPPQLRAFQYNDPITGEVRQVSAMISLPETVVAQPLYHQEEIGKPRWIIEIWRDVGDCAGHFKQEGYYHLLTVQKEPINEQTGMGDYREIDSDILETIKGMYHFMENTTESQREEMRARDEEKAQEAHKKRQEAIWEDFEPERTLSL